MLRALYDRVMRLSASRHAPWALLGIAVAESSFFPVPPDVLLAPMVLTRPDRAWRYAAITTAGSIVGGLGGYGIGYALAPVGRWILAMTGHPGGEAALQAGFAHWGVGLILIQGLLPVPYKLVTITCGLAHFTLWQFVAASCVTRSARFFGVTALVKRYGPTLLPMIERRLAIAAGAVLTAVALLLLGMRFFALGLKIGDTPRVNRLSRHWPLAALLAAAALLAIAHAFETFGHLAPCELCLKQRGVYWAVIVLCVVGLAAQALYRRKAITRLLNFALIALFALEAGIAIYHAGVEWKWWQGPLSCSGGAMRVDPAALRRLLAGETLKVVACDHPAWVFLGLSMAGWNAVAASILTVVSAVAAFPGRARA